MYLRKYLYFLSFSSVLIFTTMSCTNSFQLTEGEVELPIVYGVISATDTATYIRVERAFVDEATSAYVLSKDPNQLYFKDITVKIQNVKTKKDYVLKRVDGNLEGYKRDKGAFADAPNYLYKIKRSEFPIKGSEEYMLVISREDGSILTQATTKALVPYENGDVSNPGPTSLLAFVNNNDFKVRWFGDANAVIHDVRLLFDIREEKAGKLKDTTVTWTVVKNHDKTEYNIKGRVFYEFMQGALTKDPLIKRYFQSATLLIVSGAKEIKQYISIGQANLGITSSGEIPVYSNLSKGEGIFSAKTEFRRPDIGLSSVTLDSLRNGVITKSLNFQ